MTHRTKSAPAGGCVQILDYIAVLAVHRIHKEAK